MFTVPHTIEEAQIELEHRCDGPITCFVLIVRACELAQRPGVDAELVGNALHACLTAYGWLADDGARHATGS